MLVIEEDRPRLARVGEECEDGCGQTLRGGEGKPLSSDDPIVINIHVGVIEVEFHLVDLVEEVNEGVGAVVITEKGLLGVVLPLQLVVNDEELDGIGEGLAGKGVADKGAPLALD